MNPEPQQKQLEAVFDRVFREIAQQTAGIRLYEGAEEPSGTLCTVYAEFRRAFQTSLSMCADAAVFARLTRHMLRREEVTRENVEDSSKEYFNILCGHIASGLYEEIRVAPWFTPPTFHYGQFRPLGRGTHFSLRYTSDAKDNMLLVHYTVPR